MSSSSATSARPPLRLNEEKHLLYCALELIVSASAEMPHVIPPLGRCLVGLLSPQAEEWNAFDEFVTVAICGRDLVVELNLPDDGTAVQETNLIRKRLSIQGDLMDSMTDVGRVARLCRRFETQPGGTASSPRRHPLLGAMEKDSSSLLVFVSTYYSAPCRIWPARDGGAKSQPFETKPWQSDSGYRTNFAFCGPRGYEFIARATYYEGILRFWPSADILATTDEEESKKLAINCSVCEHISAVVSHPLRNNECLTVGVTSAMPERLFLFFYGFLPNDSSSSAQPKPRQLIAPVNLTDISGNGFVDCLCACHDDQRTLAVFQNGGVLELFSGIPELQTASWRYETDLGDAKTSSTVFPQEKVFSTGITRVIDLVPMKNKDLMAIASSQRGMYAMLVYNITTKFHIYGVEFPGSNPPRCLCTMPREDWERLCERLEE